MIEGGAAAVGAAGATAVGWVWEKFGKEIARSAKAGLAALWGRVQWSHKEALYRDRLLEQYSTTRILGNPREIRIDEIYTDAYVFDKVTALRRLSIEDLAESESATGAWNSDQTRRGLASGALKVRRIALKDLALRQKRLYILGKPGAGKSTFLRHLTLLCCKGDVPKTPIFISMKSWADSGLKLQDFIDKEFEICDFPSARSFVSALLTSGRAVVLFDGLDEVNQEGEQRAKMIRTLTDFARTYPRTQIAVTCRIAATDYSFEKFAYVEVADFTEEQQRDFVKKWYSQTPQRHELFFKEWARPENQGLRALAKTPLLLALMCLAFDETISFPRRRVEIYQDAIAALLKKWDSSRGIVRDSLYRRLSLVRKEQLLSRIAAETFRASDLFMSQKRLVAMINEYLRQLPPEDREQPIDGGAVLQAMEVQHGILVERAFQIYAFSHLTFHEYFAARFFVENATSADLAELVRDHAFNDQWREVFILIASLLDNGDVFLTAFLTAIRGMVKQRPRILKLLEEVRAGAEPGANPRKRRVSSSTNLRTQRGAVEWNTCLDAALGIAVELSSAGSEDKSGAIWRARHLAGVIQTDPESLEEVLAQSEDMEILAAYLKATHLFLECMNVAVAKARGAYFAQVLAVNRR